MYTFTNLQAIDTHSLHHTFLQAFSDYAVPIDMPFASFQAMLTRRGYAPEHSVGAFAQPGNKLVGFILNGFRTWQGKSTAYDLGTGVIPAHRKQGLSRSMFQSVREILAQQHTEQYLLEVLKNNRAALALYQNQGLAITRKFSVFRLNKSRFSATKPAHELLLYPGFPPNALAQMSAFWDCEPSWQNSTDSVIALPEAFCCATVQRGGECIGYGIIDRQTGDIPQIAVHKAHRQTGIATSLLAALLQNTKADTVQVANVDNRCETMKAFLHAAGFELFAEQYEMTLSLA